MLRKWLPALSVVFLAGGALLAEDEIYIRGKDKPFKGTIKTESPKQITMGKDTFPAEDVVDVIYEIKDIAASIPYRGSKENSATKLEKDSLDAAFEGKRKDKLAQALAKYEEVLPKVPAAETAARRHVEFKIAILRVRQVQEDGEAPDKAIAKLKEFAKKHAVGWQIGSVYQTLGRMLIDDAKYAEAEDVYSKLAKLDG